MWLVLGHGSLYVQDGDRIRCSPIDKSIWLSSPHTSVDMDSDTLPDIVFDLRKMPWTFALDESYDNIVDTSGIALESFYRSTCFDREIRRVLKKGGTFYGRRCYVVRKDEAEVDTIPPSPATHPHKHEMSEYDIFSSSDCEFELERV
jgi:hypothetical protein